MLPLHSLFHLCPSKSLCPTFPFVPLSSLSVVPPSLSSFLSLSLFVVSPLYLPSPPFLASSLPLSLRPSTTPPSLSLVSPPLIHFLTTSVTPPPSSSPSIPCSSPFLLHFRLSSTFIRHSSVSLFPLLLVLIRFSSLSVYHLIRLLTSLSYVPSLLTVPHLTLICFGGPVLEYLSIDEKAKGSNPGWSKGVFFCAKNINKQARCLGGPTKVRIPGATIARKKYLLCNQ